jgi:O-acetyl-ADP-ribose deacetylase (regulator of RNase III)
MALQFMHKYELSSTLALYIIRGSVLDFASKNGAIVNAANEGCLGGGGVDGAITIAGGPKLAKDRKKLKLIKRGIRCLTGDAVITGPNEYGKIQTPYVIHAVGPNYWEQPDSEAAHELLRRAYQASLQLADDHGLTEIAFPLLSAGVFRASIPLSVILKNAVVGISEWRKDGSTSLEKVILYAFTPEECDELRMVCEDLLGKGNFDTQNTLSEPADLPDPMDTN